MSLPCLRRWCHPFYRHLGLSPGTPKGGRGEEMGEQHEDIPCGYLPALPLQHLACLLLQGCSCVLGMWQRGETPPPQPLSATASHSSMRPLGQGQEGCLRSQTPEDGEVSALHFTACPKSRDIPFLPSSLGLGYSFGGTKACRGVKQSSFPGCNLGCPASREGWPGRGAALWIPQPPGQAQCPEPSSGLRSRPPPALEEYRWLMPSACMKYPICRETKGALCY